MPDYKSMYFALFNKVTDAIELLKTAQQETEEMFIQMDAVISDEDEQTKNQQE